MRHDPSHAEIFLRVSLLLIRAKLRRMDSIHSMCVLYAIIFFFAVIRLSWSIPQPHSSSAKVRVIKKSPRVINRFTKYHPLKKYNIESRLSDTISYAEIAASHPLHNRDDLGVVDAADLPDQGDYISPVIIGDGDTAKTFFIVLDTGSADFWVFSNLLNNEMVLEHHNVYEPLDSPTAVITGQIWNVTYGTGSAAGIVFNDTLTIGGFDIKNQSVQAAVQVDPIVFSSPNLTLDGILGLAPFTSRNTITPGNASSVAQNLFNNTEHLDKSIFTASLTRPDESEGFFTFGFIDNELVGNNTITYTPVIKDRSFWQVPSRFISVNGNKTELPKNEAIIDTGTTLIYLSDNLLPSIYEPIGGIFNDTLQIWVFPANLTDSQLPTIVLPIDNHPITLAKKDIISEPLDENWNVGSIQSSGNGTTYVYGQVWLINVYAIFDLADGENFRFGFVPRNSTEI